MKFLRRKTLVIIAVLVMMLLAGEVQVVEGLPATGVKEPTSKQDTMKEEPHVEENSLKDAAPEKAEQGGGGEASAGEDEKKVEEETSNAKDGGDDSVAKESSDTNGGGNDGKNGTELEILESTASAKDNGEATKTGEITLTTTALDPSNMTTNSNSTQMTNSPELGSGENLTEMDLSTDSHETYASAGGDTMVSDGSSSEASSFVAIGSSSSSSPPVDNQEIPPPGKQKPTESNENNQKEDSGLGKAAANDDQPKIAKLEESSNGAGKDEVALQEESAKGPNPDPIQEVKPVESDSPKTGEDAMGAPEVKEESAVDTPMETSFEKQMGSGAVDPPQSNFFSYFIVLAIITIIAYLVFHNKKKILGLIVEGRSGRQAGRRRSGGREYRKLDSNMEDMMETGRETSMRQVIY